MFSKRAVLWVSAISFFLFGMAFFAPLISGCGGSTEAHVTYELPGATVISVSTSPSPLTASGGRVSLDLSVYRRGGTYLAAGAQPPTVLLLDAGSGDTVGEYPLVLVKAYGGSFEGELSGDYTGELPIPPNESSSPMLYRLRCKIPRLDGPAHLEDLPTDAAPLTVPVP